MKTLVLAVLTILSACTPLSEAYLMGTSEAMRKERENGAIVRAEMRARGEVPWWP